MTYLIIASLITNIIFFSVVLLYKKQTNIIFKTLKMFDNTNEDKAIVSKELLKFYTKISTLQTSQGKAIEEIVKYEIEEKKENELFKKSVGEALMIFAQELGLVEHGSSLSSDNTDLFFKDAKPKKVN